LRHGLSKAGRADLSRVMVLRAAGNCDQQRPGLSAAESLTETRIGQSSRRFTARMASR
jgi:purine nucleoside permease